MGKIYFGLLSVLVLASCSVDSEDTSALEDVKGAIEVGGAFPGFGEVFNGKMIRLVSDAKVSTATVASRSCAGRTIDSMVDQERAITSRTSSCDPLSLMTPNFGYQMWNYWEIAPGTTAYFADYFNTGAPGSVFIQDFMTSHFQGLRNEGPPPPIAPGMIRTWVDDSFFSILYEEVPDSNGDFANLGNDQGLNISTESLEFLRDELVCEILDVYFDDYFGSTAPDGFGYLIGDVSVDIVDPLCGNARGLFAHVNIGHYVYTAPDFPIIE